MEFSFFDIEEEVIYSVEIKHCVDFHEKNLGLLLNVSPPIKGSLFKASTDKEYIAVIARYKGEALVPRLKLREIVVNVCIPLDLVNPKTGQYLFVARGKLMPSREEMKINTSVYSTITLGQPQVIPLHLL